MKKLRDKNYGPIDCKLCGIRFKPDHPRLKLCSQCRDIKCSDCGSPLNISIARIIKNRYRVCRECFKNPGYGSRRPKQIGATRRGVDGYIMIRTIDGWRREHRVVMEKKLGRKLMEYEIVHHIDGDRSNNDPDNLMIEASIRDHLEKHHKSNLKNPPIHHKGRKKWTESEKREFNKK